MSLPGMPSSMKLFQPFLAPEKFGVREPQFPPSASLLATCATPGSTVSRATMSRPRCMRPSIWLLVSSALTPAVSVSTAAPSAWTVTVSVTAPIDSGMLPRAKAWSALMMMPVCS